MKKLILLFVFIITQTSFNTVSFNDSFDYFMKLYEDDKDKCFELAKSRLDDSTTNFAPYYFLLRIALDEYQDLSYIGFIESSTFHVGSSKIYSINDYVEFMYNMIYYTNKIYDFADEEELYETHSFMLFGDMIEELDDLCRTLHTQDELSLKEELLKRANRFYSIEIIDVSEHGSITSRTSKDERITNAYPNIEVSKFFNGVPTGKEVVLSSDKDIELEFLDILNKARVDKGLNPLKLDYDLCGAARYHSYDMGSQNYFTHASYDRPNNSGKIIEICSTFERIRKWKNNYNMGENIAAGTGSAEGVYNQWFNSSGHKKNMFNSSWTKIGIGFVKVPGSKFTYYWTTDFSK